jgi:hypothetical protein
MPEKKSIKTNTVSQPQVSPEIPSHSNTFLIILLIILGLSLLLLGFVLGNEYFSMNQNKVVTPSSKSVKLPVNEASSGAEMVDWKTYTNEKYGFNVKYPQNIVVRENIHNGNETTVSLLFKKLEKNESLCNETHLDINIDNIGECGSLAYKGTTSKIADYNYVLGGIPTIRHDDYFQDKHVESRLDTLVYLNNNFLINYFISPSDYFDLDNKHKIFNQILSTFKFTTKSTNEPEVSEPITNSTVKSPLLVKGKVPAGWMFEGQFPIKLTDANKKVIITGIAKEIVPGSWQNNSPVDFQSSLTFGVSTGSGYLILENDNPSGDPSKNKTFEVPVNF